MRPKKTKEDLARLAAIHNMPCICCVDESIDRAREFEQPNKTTAHHLVDMGTRELSGGDQATLPLCQWHHLGYPREGFDNIDMLAKYGPSLFHTKKLFNDRYGGERALLETVNGEIDSYADGY